MKTHDEVVKALIERSGVRAEVKRIEREEGELLEALLKARLNRPGDYLKRIQSRFPELAKLNFDKLLKSKCQDKVFRLRSGEETKSLAATFRQLMRDSGLDKDKPVKERRSLYSLRHTYAHFSILNDAMDVYTLAEQMGTSVKMIEQHYGHLKPAQKARQIAGRRFVRA